MENFKFRDYDVSGKMYTFCEAVEPAFLVGVDSEMRLRYGEFDELVPLLDEYSKLERVAVISLPKNQDEIDGLFQSTGLMQRFIQGWKKLNNLK